jgi:uncharacterized damage-inducible protein DinB
MKKMLLVASALLLFSFLTADKKITKKERDYAVNLLKDTEKAVFDEVKGLSDAQLKFKPGPDRWSVEECVKHIAISEQSLWFLTDSILKQPAMPDKRSDIKVTDEQLIQKVEDRTNKVKTTEKLKPENTPFTSASDALDFFKTNREKLIDYVKTTNDDLRNHIATMPFGPVDGYQLILFTAAHSNRHTQQIKEVKADPDFPKQ